MRDVPDAPVLGFSNKQDLPGAKSAAEIAVALDLGKLRQRRWIAVACSAVDRRGIAEGMD